MNATARVLIITERPADAPGLREALSAPLPEGQGLVVDHPPLAVDEGLACLAAEGADVVLLDVADQPDAGLAALRRIRAQAPRVPVVVATGAGAALAPFAALAAEQGAHDVVARDGLDPASLRRMLRYALERERLHDTLRQLALSDELTGLYNRRGFFALGDHHRRLASRTRGLMLAVVDVDGLHRVNERHGREEGDRVLLATAGVLRDTFRASDVIARLAGDDFAVLVPDATPEAEAAVAERLRHRLERHNADHAERPYALALSMGLARVAPGDRTVIEELLVHAGEQLAARKRR